ncbi:MAG TPA: hypothetical protein VNZ94_01865 [Xanthobacteraceae bacterium]|nr:hypothetical protein [Xanthobacteraceae bacterium]
MTKTVARSVPKKKSADCRIRNQNCRIRNQISPAMQKVRDSLPPHKSAYHLHILTDQPLSTCQKMLTGGRAENLEMITALLRSEMGREVLFALMGDAQPAWFVRYSKQLDVERARKMLRDLERTAASVGEDA